jgi:tetratricopeptide (TPR) repeat protein
MIFPASVFAQVKAGKPATSSQAAKQPAPYKPHMVVDGVFVPDSELIHLPNYRAHFSRGFAQQPQLRMVDYGQVAEWKKKFKFNEQNVHDSYLVRARASLASGKKAYQELDFEKAMEDLTESRKEFILNLSHLRSNRDLLEAHLYLGMTYIALAKKTKSADEIKKNEKLAESEFEKVVMLDPQRELAPRSYSPKVIEMYEKAKRKLVSGNRITVKVDANAPQAKVFINGKLIGPTPIKVNLIPGDYYVLVERKGMKSWSKLAKFENPVEHLSAEMETATENGDWNGMFQIREGMDQQTANMDEIDGMADAVGGEMILLANLEKPGNDWRLLGQLYDSRTHEFSQTAVVHVGPLEDFEPAAYEMAEALASMIRYDGYLSSSAQQQTNLMGMDPSRVGEGQPQAMQEHAAPKEKIYEKWWFWAGVGVIAVGAYLGISQLGGTDGSSIIVNNDGNF